VTCPNPATAGQLKRNPDGSYVDPNGPRGCVSHSGSYNLCAATNGAKSATGRQITTWTGDRSGGLELQQVDDALRVHEHFQIDTVVCGWSEFEDRIDSGKEYATLIGGYGPFSDSRFAGQQNASFNHGISVPGWAVMDPLADGRHAGVYRYKGEKYPKDLIHDFAAALMTGSGRAGRNHVEASFFPVSAKPPAWQVTIQGTFAFYYLNGNRIDHRGKAHTFANAQVYRCTGPSLTRWANDHHTSHGYVPRAVRLATITAGIYKGRSVNVDNTAVHLERIP